MIHIVRAARLRVHHQAQPALARRVHHQVHRVHQNLQAVQVRAHQNHRVHHRAAQVHPAQAHRVQVLRVHPAQARVAQAQKVHHLSARYVL